MITYSIIKKSELEGAHRLDAEYYQPEYLDAQKKVEKFGCKNLGDIIDVLTDYHANGSYETLRHHVQLLNETNFAYMVRAVDLETGNFDTDVRYVSKSAYEFLKKSKIFGREVIIDKIGNAGVVYYMPKLNRPVTLGMNLFMLRLKKGYIEPEFLYIFLNSKYGKLLISQKITGTVPTSIDKESVRSIKVPMVSTEFSEKIKRIIEETEVLKQKSLDFYSQAEDLLLEELGLKDWIPDSAKGGQASGNDICWTVNFSEIKEANRMDAEYFQPKYERLESGIKNHESSKLGDLVAMKKGFEPGSEAYQEKGKLFIRVSSLSKLGIENKDQKYLREDLYQKLKKDYEPKVGEILLTKDATPGIAYVVKEKVEGIISGGIMRLKLKEEIEQEYLALCLNSAVGQMQAERDAGGSIIAHWKPEQIKNLLAPILPQTIQKKIANLVRQSHEARKKAEELLEEAKHKVEELIEKGS